MTLRDVTSAVFDTKDGEVDAEQDDPAEDNGDRKGVDEDREQDDCDLEDDDPREEDDPGRA